MRREGSVRPTAAVRSIASWLRKTFRQRLATGVSLRADVYRPDAAERFPVLLSRLPYNKNLRTRLGDIDYFVERGYVVIMQDTRGRFASEGIDPSPPPVTASTATT